ncbi:DHA2 family efflux MFS transporter permease subunit [Mycobacterium sp. 050134]|uniref:DHA2 family efflux MFS transporter permease subunit n=1 Tax=Mycobacterium sp. 050134 TaxID=3096111 RepID=UPI002ED7DA43
MFLTSAGDAEPCPAAEVSAARSGSLDARLALVALACTLLPALVTLDATIANVAQRTFVDQFSSTPAVVAWTVTGYSLALAAAIPITGWAAGRVGTKVLALGSVALFSWASLLCAQAPSVALMVTFRVLQGFAGGTLVPLQLAILAHAAGPRRMGRVLPISTVPALLTPIYGPMLGGWLIGSFGWQAVFLINVPIGLLTLIVAGFVLPENVPAPEKGLDGVGFLLLSPGLALFLYGVSQLPEHRAFAEAHVPAAAGVLLIGAFVVRALRRPEGALIDLRLLKHRDVAAANAVRFLFAIAFFGSCLILPGYFQQVLWKTPLQAGMLLVPQTLGAAAVRPIVGRLTQRYGARRVVLTGIALGAAGLTAFVCGIRGDIGKLMAGLALLGIGSGCVATPVSRSAVQTLPDRRIGDGTTLFNVNHHVAACVGAALMSVILTDGATHATADISRAYGGAFLVALALLAAAAVPASFLPRGADGRRAR